MNQPDRLRALLAQPGFIAMPAVWDGLSAKLTANAGFKTAFLSGSCVAAARLGGPDLDLLSFGEIAGLGHLVARDFRLVDGHVGGDVARTDHRGTNAGVATLAAHAVRECDDGELGHGVADVGAHAPAGQGAEIDDAPVFTRGAA